MKPLFIGRTEELEELHRHVKKNIASLIVVKGRRRIGKSRLIEEFAKDYSFYEFSGLVPTEKTTKQNQIDEFANQLGLVLGVPGVKADDWNTLFLFLAKHTQKGRVIILLDEISWMGSEDSDFLGKLKNAWDLHFKKNPRLILIICGSASAWIDKNILSSTAFMGRVSYTLTVDELPLSDCSVFWKRVGSQFSSYDKFKVLSITGGIPRYLEEIQPQYSAEENIRHLCFKKGGLLTHEFKDIFSDLFGKRSEKYKEIVRLLVQSNLEYGEICNQLDMRKSGLISEYLNDLVMSGFISRDHTWNPKTGITAPLLFKYRLRDNYLRFYLKYIENKLPEIDRNVYQLKSLSSLPGFATIIGLQFENLVLNNRDFIHRCLKLSANDIVVENPYFQHTKSRQPGCQIDYMIQTRTNVVYVCEIKFSRHEIKKDIIKEVKAKIDRLSIPRGMSFCPVLIHVNGVGDSVIDEAYFTEIIDFGDVLKD
ncbi:MAG: ATPase [Gammaproteobacteria bacterium RIFCSPHIGHO2_12_FULL_37_34]|nr:MAG: ATPase [Gammaproteobacteria bacterium RIFCSPHIGHO2_12_FULL_37_34]HLB42459.1 ATP-binding protein [Gammaproteobacteria bacterium]